MINKINSSKNASARTEDPLARLAAQAKFVHKKTRRRKTTAPEHTTRELRALLQAWQDVIQRVYHALHDDDARWLAEARTRRDLPQWAAAGRAHRLGHPLVGVGIGPEREKQPAETNKPGRQTGRLAIQMYLARNDHPCREHAAFMTRGLNRNVSVEFVPSGAFEMLSPSGSIQDGKNVERQSPIFCGASLGNTTGEGMAGTLGCKVLRNGKVCILSCAHVLDSEMRVLKGEVAPGDVSAVQPGLLDESTAFRDPIGPVVAVAWPNPAIGTDGDVDAAVAELGPLRIVSGQLPDGQLLSSENLGVSTGLGVSKFGRTTKETFGWISDLNATVQVTYPDPIGVVTLTQQIMVVGEKNIAFSMPGDSGAVVFGREQEQPIGLLFADNRGREGQFFSVCCPWQRVLSRLGIERLLPRFENV